MRSGSDSAWRWCIIVFHHHYALKQDTVSLCSSTLATSETKLTNFLCLEEPYFKKWMSGRGVWFHRATLNFIFHYAVTKHTCIPTLFVCERTKIHVPTAGVFSESCVLDLICLLYFFTCVLKRLTFLQVKCSVEAQRSKTMIFPPKNVNTVVLPKYCWVCLSSPRTVLAKPIVGVWNCFCRKMKDR